MKKLLVVLVVVGLMLSVATPAYAEYIIYTVQPGDTLYGIARKFGASPEDIIAINRLTNPNQLRAGQLLLIPGATQPRPTLVATRKYVVQSGDTLEKIARRFGVSLATLMTDNRIKNPDQIRVGQRLLILSRISEGWTTFTLPEAEFSNFAVVALAIDQQDRAWTQADYGVQLLNSDGRWVNYFAENSGAASGMADMAALSSPNSVESLAIDDQGRVWMGTDGGGLNVLVPNSSWKIYTTENSKLASNYIESVIIDKQGRVWAATNKGLSVLAPDGSWTTHSQWAYNAITSLAVDSRGNAWVGTFDGLSLLVTDGRLLNFTTANSKLTDNSITALLVDNQGRTWVGTEAGLNVITPDGSWQTYTPTNSDLSNGRVYALGIDSQGRLWVGTQDGLNMLAPSGEWVTYTTSNPGLNREAVFSLAIDKHDRVWVGLRSRIRVFDLFSNISGQTK